jgi:4-azaleucine resistance transporter AzlC
VTGAEQQLAGSRLASTNAGTRIVLPLAGATVLDGLAFGLLARSVGLGGGTAIAMSALAFSGSAQFAAIGVVGAGGGIVAAVLPALLLNARSLPIGLSVASVLHGGRGRRALEAQLVIDESWAASQVAPGCFDRRLLLVVGATQWIAWVGGTILGVAGAGIVGDPHRFGLDAVVPALFLALLVPQLRSRNARQAAGCGAAITLALTPFAPPGIPVAAAVLATMVAWRGR